MNETLDKILPCIQWLCGQEEVVGGPKNLYFCPRSGLKMPINQGTKLKIKVEKVKQ